MEAAQSVPDLIAAAQARVAALGQGPGAPDGVRAIEAAAVDIFTLFEARMQTHFKRGPFARKLKAVLVGAGKADLAERFHLYYLAVNVLKHGKGASYRELQATPTALFAVKPGAEVVGDDAPVGLVDVSGAGVFDGLCATLLEAHAFLESQ